MNIDAYKIALLGIIIIGIILCLQSQYQYVVGIITLIGGILVPSPGERNASTTASESDGTVQ